MSRTQTRELENVSSILAIEEKACEKLPLSYVSSGLPLSQIKYPAITICSQGLIQDVINKALAKQFSDYITKSGKDPGSMTDQEKEQWQKNYSSTLYPGAIASPLSMVNMLTSENPTESLKSQILTDPSATCIEISSQCDSPWMNSSHAGWLAYDPPPCFANPGKGSGYSDLCQNEGGVQVSFDENEPFGILLYDMMSMPNGE